MKRNIHLQELSRDHHHGLLLGWKIRQGLKYGVNPQIIAEYVSYFFVEALVPHFKEEETHILSCLSDNDELKQRILKEHNNISELIGTLSSSPEVSETLLKVASEIDEHIRFEERELFPYLEEVLDDSVLETIGADIASGHLPFIEKYPLEFWKKSN